MINCYILHSISAFRTIQNITKAQIIIRFISTQYCWQILKKGTSPDHIIEACVSGRWSARPPMSAVEYSHQILAFIPKWSYKLEVIKSSISIWNFICNSIFNLLNAPQWYSSCQPISDKLKKILKWYYISKKMKIRWVWWMRILKFCSKNALTNDFSSFLKRCNFSAKF